MKKKTRFLVLIGGLFMVSALSGCETKSQEEVEQSFDKVLAMYPTENLMDFYDMEGYRDENFEEDDKGVWVLQSRMSIRKAEEEPLISEGMVLRIDRNTHKAEGYYYKKETKLPDRSELRYPVIYDEKGIRLVEDISDSELKTKIENFQFFVQYGKFDDLTQYENIRKMYNPEVPIYELEYQLANEEYNVKQLRERYDIPTDDAPTLLLKGRGYLDGSSVGYKNIEIRFSKRPSIVFADSIDYQPATEEDNE